MDNFLVTLYIHALVTWMLIGMTWFTQVIHYPRFKCGFGLAGLVQGYSKTSREEGGAAEREE